MIKRIEHMGIAVRNLDEALARYEKLFGLKPSRIGVSELQGVKAAFLPVGNSEIELLEPLQPDSPVGRFMSSMGEDRFYHPSTACKIGLNQTWGFWHY